MKYMPTLKLIPKTNPMWVNMPYRHIVTWSVWEWVMENCCRNTKHRPGQLPNKWPVDSHFQLWTHGTSIGTSIDYIYIYIHHITLIGGQLLSHFEIRVKVAFLPRCDCPCFARGDHVPRSLCNFCRETGLVARSARISTP